MATKLSRILYDQFFSSSTAYAVGSVNGDGKVKYTTHEKLPDLKEIEKHMAGDTVLGAYTVQPGDTVTWLAWDIDSNAGIEVSRELTKKLSDFLTSHKIPHGIEFSGNRGYHLYVFFVGKESAEDAKNAGDSIRDQLGLPKSGDPHVEVFPKQGHLTDSSPYGNLLRLPLGAHPKTKIKTFFVGMDAWEDGEALDAEEVFSNKTSLASLQKIISEGDFSEQVTALLSAYWSSGQRHDISLYLSGYLASMDVVESDTLEILDKIHAAVPEGDIDDQKGTVKSTYKKHHAGEAIAGLSGLSKILPMTVLNKLHEVVGRKSSPSAMLALDSIRLGKGAVFLKVRSASLSVLSHLNEAGRLVRAGPDIYWLDQKSHDLIGFETRGWQRYTHNIFGINLRESFGTQVMESLTHLSYDRAKEVTIKKRSHWDGDKNYLNLGGPEIYVFNGDRSKREFIYNGEIDIIFKNAEDSFHLPNLFLSEEAALSPWPYLTDDVNYMEGVDGTTPEQQRELSKAYFMATFFGEIMPTRPIYTILGLSGTGKTTTARRFLRVLEGPSSDVLTINNDKEDSFRASVVSHRFMVLDNLEKALAKWLPDALNRIATGAQIELRELHTTNNMRNFPVDIFLSLTATEMPFSDETVYTRMLPIQLGPILTRRNENVMQSDLINNFNAIWKGIFDNLDDTIAQLKAVTSVVVPSDTRLADFAVFCNRIKGASFMDGDVLMAGLGNLVNRQKQILEENSPFIDVLNVFMTTIPSGDTGFIPASELYARCQKIAALGRMEWRWTTVQALAKHLAMMEPQLIQHYGLTVRPFRENGREIKKYKFIRKIMTT